MRVDLSPGEVATANFLATMRQLQNRDAGIGDQRRDDARSGFALDRLGVIAELAWFKHWGRFPDLSLCPRHGGPDDVLFGKTVDIKATDLPSGRLVAKKGADNMDIFALGIVHEVGARVAVDFVGYATGGELLCADTLSDIGHGPTHVLAQRQLHRWKGDHQ